MENNCSRAFSTRNGASHKKEVQKIKFSFIVPVYNVAPYLRECLDSLLAQDIPAGEYEIIAVNDGSTDGSPAILSEYEAAHPGRFVVIDQPNTGPGPSRNIGFAASRGDYIWFIDSDDVAKRNSLHAIVKALETTGAEILLMRHEMFWTDSVPAAEESVRDGKFAVTPSSPTEALCFHSAAAWDKVFSREFLIRAKISYPAVRILEDIAETYRLMAQAKIIVKTGTVCYFYRRRPGSVSQAFNERSMQDMICVFKTIKSQIQLFPELRDEYEYLLWKELEWAIGDTEKEVPRCNAESRAAVASHLPTLKTMLAAAENPANPYIRLINEQRKCLNDMARAYKSSISWKITAPLRRMHDLLIKILKK